MILLQILNNMLQILLLRPLFLSLLLERSAAYAVIVSLILSAAAHEHRCKQWFYFFGLRTQFQGTRTTWGRVRLTPGTPSCLISAPGTPALAGPLDFPLGEV